MYKALKNDLDNLDALLSLTKEKAIDYLSQLEEMHVSKPVEKKNDADLTLDGIGLHDTIAAFYRQHFDKIVGASGPKYWGYVIGGTTPASIAGDWLSTVFDQNPQGVKNGGDVSALIENQTINWLLDLFSLSKAFQGGFVSGATMSNFTCLAIARQWAGLRKNNNIAEEGIHTTIKILTATPHSSVIKSLAMLGLGSSNIIKVKTAEGNREAMDINDLSLMLQENNEYPIIVISSAGTVNSADFDDFQAVSLLRQRYNFFWHIDAAFGAFAACSEKFRSLLNGWQYADSITIDCHKWLNVPYDSAVYLLKEKHMELQLQTFKNGNAPYLGDVNTDFNYLNALPENSRRLRALPAWFSLVAYGKNGYKWIVENSIERAAQFAELIESKTIFKLAAPLRLNVVCFTTEDDNKRELKINKILAKLNERGNYFFTPTVYKEVVCIRAAFVNWRTKFSDVENAIDELIIVSKSII